MDNWPSDIPNTAKARSYSEKPNDNLISTQPDAGPPMSRPRSTATTTAIGYTVEMSNAQADQLLAFWKGTLMSGSLPFTMAHPRTGVLDLFKFSSPPSITAAEAPERCDVALSLLRMP